MAEEIQRMTYRSCHLDLEGNLLGKEWDESTLSKQSLCAKSMELCVDVRCLKRREELQVIRA